MSVKTILRRNNLGTSTPDTEDKYSPGVWADCPYEAIRDGLLPGSFFEFNFDSMPKTPATTEGNFGPFTQFSDTGGFINAITTGRGWTLGSDGDNEGCSIRARATPFQIIRTAKKLWFEAAVKMSTIADTKNGWMLGLAADVAFTAILPITAAGAIADLNVVGFMRPEGDGDGIDTVYKADGVTAVTVGTDAVVPVADTWVKLGFTFDVDADPFVHDPDRSGNKYLLKFFENGVPLADYKQIPSAAGTDFPNDVFLTPFFAVLNATGSTPGDVSIRRLRCVQLGS
jgi:hypothetical protein